MAEPHKNAPRTINPRSRITKVGTRTDAIARRPGVPRRQVAAYPCPYCTKRMFADEVIDFGTANGRTGKYHRECKTKNSSH